MSSAVFHRRDESFPAQLREIPDPPTRIYLTGEIPAGKMVAIVGSRRASAYGRRVATALGARLSQRGVTVVSGLAFGIDAAVHTAVLDSRGSTVAVMPGGLDERSVSPRTNLPLARRILRQGGAWLSEYPPGTSARKEYFTARNRLIAGLADEVVLVEAALPSGSLVTADHAAAQGKDVWAVPGPIDSLTSIGTNLLIAQGASPLHSLEEFLDRFGQVAVSDERHLLLEAIGQGVRHVEELMAELPYDPGSLEAELAKLELLGLVRHLGNRYYTKT